MIRTNKTFINTWYLLIDSLNELRILRDRYEENQLCTEFKIASLNASMIVSLAALTEGAISSLFISKLENDKEYKNSKKNHQGLTYRLYESQLNSIPKKSWKELREHSSIIIGFNLNSVYQKDWEAILSLFEFRNILAHGGTIVKTTKRISDASSVLDLHLFDEKQESDITKEKLFNYLSVQGLCESIANDDSFLRWSIINTKLTNFFMAHAKQFLLAIYTKFQEAHNLNNFLKNDLNMIETIVVH